MKKWGLTDVQAEAILNMRLRALRKLEEFEIRKELDGLKGEKRDLTGLLKNEDRRWQAIGEQIADIKKKFGQSTKEGKRRTEIGDAPSAEIIPLDTMVEREPVTVVCSDKGWIRALRGHMEEGAEVKYKEGDRDRFRLHAETTDKLLVLATNGRIYTLGVDKLPGGRGHGEPVRLLADFGNDVDVAAMIVHKPGRKCLVASTDGRGFIVLEDEVVAFTRNGKQLMNVGEGAEARVFAPAEGDHVAVIGENRKMVVFPIDEVPEMARGRGVTLQRYKDGVLSDACVFTLAEGLAWRSGSRTRVLTKAELKEWIGKRAQAGRLPPHGAPRATTFG
jgi:topoisomerase-4 subunit A